jgi:hypothetical protein
MLGLSDIVDSSDASVIVHYGIAIMNQEERYPVNKRIGRNADRRSFQKYDNCYTKI